MIRLISLRVSVFLTVVFAFFQVNVVYAQQEQAASTEGPESAQTKKYTINTINFSDQEISLNMPLLTEYFQCRAAVKDDIGECDKMSSSAGHTDVCRRYFNKWNFFIKLLTEGPNSSVAFDRATNELEQFKGKTKKEIREFFVAWLKNDSSYCDGALPDDAVNRNERINKCKSIITGDSNYCNGDDTKCVDQAHFIRAIKSKDINECNRLADPFTKQMCVGYVSKSESACEKNEKFSEFKRRFLK